MDAGNVKGITYLELFGSPVIEKRLALGEATDVRRLEKLILTNLGIACGECLFMPRILG